MSNGYARNEDTVEWVRLRDEAAEKGRHFVHLAAHTRQQIQDGNKTCTEDEAWYFDKLAKEQRICVAGYERLIKYGSLEEFK
jgi:hypothetical protein